MHLYKSLIKNAFFNASVLRAAAKHCAYQTVYVFKRAALESDPVCVDLNRF